MATQFYFNNRQIMLPGAYATIKSGDSGAPRVLDYGTVLLISTGTDTNAFVGGGAAINGQLAQGQQSIYEFQTLQDFQVFVKGGMYWKWAEALFNPDPTNPAAGGISRLYFVQAATTTCATLSFNASGATGGVFSVFPKDEGVWANAVVKNDADNNAILTTGYAYKIIPSVTDPSKWVMQFYVGTFTGVAPDGLPYNEVAELNTVPTLIIESPAFNNINTLIDWAKTSSDFNASFSLDTTNTKVVGTGIVLPDTVTGLDKFSIAAGAPNSAKGGTTSQASSDFNRVLEEITDLDYNSVFTDIWGVSAFTEASLLDTKLTALINHINTVSKFQRELWIGGFNERSEFSKTLALGQKLNSSQIQTAHGNVGVASSLAGEGFRWWGVMYNLCAILGRCLGKPPYVPVTNKSIGVDMLKHILSTPQQKQALNGGVLAIVPNTSIGRYVVLQGVNTLQDNSSLFNSKGESFSIQFMRIVNQINRELIVNAEIDLLADENGVNINSLSPGVLAEWTKVYLQSRVATPYEDNLLISFKNINVKRQGDAYFVSYYIQVNNEVTKLFFTGFLLR